MVVTFKLKLNIHKNINLPYKLIYCSIKSFIVQPNNTISIHKEKRLFRNNIIVDNFNLMPFHSAN